MFTGLMQKPVPILLAAVLMVFFVEPTYSVAAQIAQQAETGSAKTVWDRVFTADQAKRGQDAYNANCSKCHSSSPDERLRGEGFMDRWREGNLVSLYLRIRNDMPQDKPGALSESTYLDILSHILNSNGMPSGNQELSKEALPNIRVQKKSGPEPLPDFSMVRVVGCLTRVDNVWILSHATDPERTTDVDSTTPAELNIARQQALGDKTYRLQNFGYLGPEFKPESHETHKMYTKGTLMKMSGGDRIQLTSMEMIDASCGS